MPRRSSPRHAFAPADAAIDFAAAAATLPAMRRHGKRSEDAARALPIFATPLLRWMIAIRFTPPRHQIDSLFISP